jgi:hypothetical protein
MIRVYTPAVGGSIPSAPANVHAGQQHTAIQLGLGGEPPLCQDCASSVRAPGPLASIFRVAHGISPLFKFSPLECGRHFGAEMRLENGQAF